MRILVNLDHVSKVELSETVDKGALRSTEAFLQSKLNTNKLEKRRIRHLEEKQNAAYALKLGIIFKFFSSLKSKFLESIVSIPSNSKILIRSGSNFSI